MMFIAISLAATAASAAIAMNASIADLPKGMPSYTELTWWTFAGMNAGLMASTAPAYQRLNNGSFRYKAMATASAMTLTLTAGVWGFLAIGASR